MGERRFPPDPIPVTVVAAPGLPGVPEQTLAQFLLKNGITRSQGEDTRGGFIQNFLSTFAIDDVLSPVQRVTRKISRTAGAPVTVFDDRIEGVKEQVIVIRALTWVVGFSGVAVPDFVSVPIKAQQDAGGLQGPYFQLDSPFVSSLRVIGDARSPLTQVFTEFLPITLLPGDAIIFRQNIAVAALLGHVIFSWEEIYQLPFRPAGL